MMALLARVVRERAPEDTDLEYSPVGSSASNGRAEHTIQIVRKQAVILRCCWESRFGLLSWARLACSPSCCATPLGFGHVSM